MVESRSRAGQTGLMASRLHCGVEVRGHSAKAVSYAEPQSAFLNHVGRAVTQGEYTTRESGETAPTQGTHQ